mmetsp:Transcript_58219/g.96139  ORF Transcript_58219/g.96139 Transcript_58219/m.96139 type:complete len:224 (-) Transcript_58219:1055-1726(-)
MRWIDNLRQALDPSCLKQRYPVRCIRRRVASCTRLLSRMPELAHIGAELRVEGVVWVRDVAHIVIDHAPPFPIKNVLMLWQPVTVLNVWTGERGRWAWSRCLSASMWQSCVADRVLDKCVHSSSSLGVAKQVPINHASSKMIAPLPLRNGSLVRVAQYCERAHALPLLPAAVGWRAAVGSMLERALCCGTLVVVGVGHNQQRTRTLPGAQELQGARSRRFGDV